MIPLRKIHSDLVFARGRGRISLDYWRNQPTVKIIDSLLPGNDEALTVKLDGRIFNGNTRIKVLEERGIDVNLLPRVHRLGS